MESDLFSQVAPSAVWAGIFTLIGSVLTFIVGMTRRKDRVTTADWNRLRHRIEGEENRAERIERENKEIKKECQDLWVKLNELNGLYVKAKLDEGKLLSVNASLHLRVESLEEMAGDLKARLIKCEERHKAQDRRKGKTGN